MIATLVLVFPIGLWVMWRRHAGWDRLTNIVVTGMVMAVAVVGLAAGTSLISSTTAAVSRADAPTASASARPTPTPAATSSPPPRPTPASTPSAEPNWPTPLPAQTAPVSTGKPPVKLCGAPSNPWGYNLCGGSLLYNPAPAFCSYFTCTRMWDQASGYVVECQDGGYSRSSGPGACEAMQPLYG